MCGSQTVLSSSRLVFLVQYMYIIMYFLLMLPSCTCSQYFSIVCLDVRALLQQGFTSKFPPMLFAVGTYHLKL